MANDLAPRGSLTGNITPEHIKVNLQEYVRTKTENPEDEAILNFLASEITPYSTFQSEAFVIANELTDHRKIQQCALELRSRMNSLNEAQYQHDKVEIEMKKFQRQLDTETDDLERQLLHLEIKKREYDLAQTRIRCEQMHMEVQRFLNLVKKIAPGNTLEKIQNYKDNWEEKDREYWIKRMGKQAMLDILASGRIQNGNLDAILGMPLDVQQEVIAYAMMNTARVEKGMSEIQETVRDVLINNEKHEQRMTLPDITGITGEYGGPTQSKINTATLGLEDAKKAIQSPKT